MLKRKCVWEHVGGPHSGCVLHSCGRSWRSGLVRKSLRWRRARDFARNWSKRESMRRCAGERVQSAACMHVRLSCMHAHAPLMHAFICASHACMHVRLSCMHAHARLVHACICTSHACMHMRLSCMHAYAPLVHACMCVSHACICASREHALSRACWLLVIFHFFGQELQRKHDYLAEALAREEWCAPWAWRGLARGQRGATPRRDGMGLDLMGSGQE